MLVSICITSFNRLDFLKQTINSILERNKDLFDDKDVELIIVDNNSNEEVKKYINIVSYQIDNCKVKFLNENFGNAKASNIAMEMSEGDFLVHLDNDIIVEYDNWILSLVNIIRKYPQIGLIGPNYPNHHLRIKYPHYDEVDYCMGCIQLIPKKIYEKIGYWDENLKRQEECDFALRVRMEGYKVALCKKFEWKSLNNEHTINKGSEHVFKFFKKWNEYFLGKPFIYKSPFMLYWDEFPPIAMFRKKLFSLYGINNNIEKQIIQEHDCDIIKVPYQPLLYRQDIIKECVKNDIQFKESNLETIDNDLLVGKRNWKIEDNIK